MTRREKFIEVFGLNPSDIPIHPEVCDALNCDEKCPFNMGTKSCLEWWNQEYVKPEKEIEYCPEDLRMYIK